MAQEYFNLEKTAEVLGVAPADVHKLRERNELHGYRDGANWKFKAEEVQDKLAELIRSRQTAEEGDEPNHEGEDVLLSEIQLGESTGDTGSVIRPGETAAVQAGSDLQLASSDADLSADDFQVADEVDMDATVADDREPVDQDATVTDDDDAMADLDLMLDDDATLEDSQVASDASDKAASGSGSSIDLSEALDDDNLVLGGASGASGSDITIGGDSGISLVDPADSGLSLEEPVDLVEAGDESLELGEDDMLVFGEEADTESPTELKTDDDFLLTPMTDGEEDEESESGSQVIALDTEAEEDEAATMVGGGAMPPMLDEDFAAEGIADMGAAPDQAPVGAAVSPMDQGPMDPGVAAGLPEAPYSVWNVLSLTFCLIFLSLTGMMLYDLLRNMWSWDGSYTVNSSLMDMIVNLLP